MSSYNKMNMYKIFGVVGLLLISAGVLDKKRKRQDILYIAGGVCLEVYSIYLNDLVFIILQIIFICSAIYDLRQIARLSTENKKS